MKEIKKMFENYINNIFLDKNFYLRPLGIILVILFGLITPFDIIYLKIKNIFKKSC